MQSGTLLPINEGDALDRVYMQSSAEASSDSSLDRGSRLGSSNNIKVTHLLPRAIFNDGVTG